MSQQGKDFKQRFDRNIHTLNHSRPVLLSGNIETEHVAAAEIIQTTMLLDL